ncbi:MAG TPA: DUF1538 domain-containing protein [Vicinamibacterales bacterium]
MSVAALLVEIGDTAQSVALAVLPLTVLFLIVQALFLNLPAREVARVLTGTLIASAGLFFFLLGVGIGFLPFGRAIGEALGSLSATWGLLPFGMLLGFVTTWGEPSVRILADQVEEASTGAIPRTLVVVTVSAGVAFAVGVGLLRIGHGLALPWIVVPGYAVMLAIMWYVDPDFVGVAIDSGGVATGPLANTFLLALAFGVAAAFGRDPLEQGLGLVALIALAPIVSVMLLGLLVGRKMRGKES